MGLHAALLASLLTPGLERNRRLDRNMRPELPFGKPESASSHFLIAEGHPTIRRWNPPESLDRRSHSAPSPANLGWFLTCRIFHLWEKWKFLWPFTSHGPKIVAPSACTIFTGAGLHMCEQSVITDSI